MTATKRAFSGKRFFSITEQDDFSTPETLTFSSNFEEAFMNVRAGERLDSADEITGKQGIERDEVLTWIGEGRHVRPLLPHEAAFFLTGVLGKVTTDQPNAGSAPNTYRHWIERRLDDPSVRAFTLVENNGATQNRYQACIARALSMIGERSNFVRLEADLQSKGEEVDDATADPGVADSGETYLRFGDVAFTRGGSLSGSVAGGDLAVGGGPTAFTASMRSFEAGWDNGAEAIHEFGDDSGHVTRFEIGDRIEHTLTTQLEFQDDGHFAGLSAETEYVLNIPLIGATIEDTQKYTVDLIYPRAKYSEVNKSRDGNKLIVDITWKILEDDTYGTFVGKVINKQSAYFG